MLVVRVNVQSLVLPGDGIRMLSENPPIPPPRGQTHQKEFFQKAKVRRPPKRPTQVVFVPVCAVSEIPDFSFGILLTSSCPVPKLLQFLNKFVGESHVRPQKGVPHIQVQLPRKAFWPNHLSFSSVPVLKYGEYFRG